MDRLKRGFSLAFVNISNLSVRRSVGRRRRRRRRRRKRSGGGLRSNEEYYWSSRDIS
jgi:hypothetical protein